MDNLKKTKGYWKLKEEAVDRTLCRTRYGSGYLETRGYFKCKQKHYIAVCGELALEEVRTCRKADN
jgi:hypothetical protein